MACSTRTGERLIESCASAGVTAASTIAVSTTTGTVIVFVFVIVVISGRGQGAINVIVTICE